MTGAAAADVADPPQAGSARRVLGSVVVAIAVAAASLVLGGLTSPAQGFLPDELSSFANSAGGWTALTFGLLWLSRARPAFAAALGIVSFVLLVEGYRIVSEWRGYEYAAPFQDTFTYIGIVAGPVVGASAGLLRWGHGIWRVLAVSTVAAVFIGEGVYGLTVVAETTSPVYWWLQITAGAVLTVVVLVARRARLVTSALTLAVIAAGSTAFWLAYRALGSI